MNTKIKFYVVLPLFVVLLSFTQSVAFAFSPLIQSSEQDPVPLVKDAPSIVDSMPKGAAVFYTFTLLDGVKNLSITTTGTSGDANIYLSKDKPQSNKASTWKSIGSRSKERIFISRPKSGLYYLTLRAFTKTTNTRVLLTYVGDSPSAPVVMCSYPTPPTNCNYVQGPLYNNTTSCGLVMSCTSKTASGASMTTVSQNALPPTFSNVSDSNGTKTGPLLLFFDTGSKGSTPSATSYPVSTPSSSTQKPQGSIDGIKTDGTIYGWSQDPDNLSVANQVHLYIDKNVGTAGASPIVLNASDYRSDVGNHAFNYTLPNQYRDGQNHQVWVWAIDLTDATGSSNVQLSGSPKSFALAVSSTPAPAPTPTPNTMSMPAPTPSPTPSQSITPTPTPNQNPTPTPTPTPVPTPTATPNLDVVTSYPTSPNPGDFVAGAMRPASVSKTLPCTGGGAYTVVAGWYAVPGGFSLGSYFPVAGTDGVCPGTSTPVVTTPAVVAPTPTPIAFNAAINGSCGASNGLFVSVAPTTNFCSAGNATAVTQDANGYFWNCIGSNGGSTSFCEAPKAAASPAPVAVNGSCSSINGTTVSSMPMTNLCSVGNASSVATNGSSYSWSCGGTNNGSTASCSASQAVAAPAPITFIPAPTPTPTPAVSVSSGGSGVDAPIPNANNFPFIYCTSSYPYGLGCQFTGLRSIRYGNGSQWVYKDFLDGFDGWKCNTANFPGANAQNGDHCEVATQNKTGTLAPPVTMQMGGSYPTVDLTAIPLGSSGAGALDIQPDPDTGIANDIGAFRIQCNFVKMAFNDPIVYPGQPGKSHLHMFFGNTDVNAYSTNASLANSGNSSCAGGIANRSSYWVPAMIDTSSGRPVMPSFSLWYYKTGYNGVVPSTVKPMPQALRMIAGNLNATGSQADKGIFWECQNMISTRSATIPSCPSGVPVSATITFPQCWDGVNLDSSDHQSHMAYPHNGCPADHPVPVPELSLHIQYGTSNEAGTMSLSSDHGGGAGISLHADFMEGWNRTVINTFTANCLNKSKDCHGELLGDGTTLGPAK